MRTEIQNSIILAQRQLSSRPLAVRILKALFLVKYYDSFKTTLRNIAVLTLNHLNVNPNAHEEEVKGALNLLEQQNYVERKGGDIYEFMTDIEKDIKQEIKNTEINFSDTTDLLSSLLFDGTIKETRL